MTVLALFELILVNKKNKKGEKNMKEIYKVVLTDVHLGLNNNFTPYVELKFETRDNNKLNLRSKYYFTNKAKYFAYKELSDLLEAFDIKTATDCIFDDLKYLIGGEMYLVKTKKLEFQYNILIDYKEETDEY